MSSRPSRHAAAIRYTEFFEGGDQEEYADREQEMYHHNGYQEYDHQYEYDRDQWSDGSLPDPVDKLEKRRRETVERLARLDHELVEHKERIYEDKLASLRAELIQIQQGTHSDFLDMMAEYEAERDQLMENSRMYREYQLAAADKLLRTETRQAEDEYKSEKQGLRDKMLQQLEEKRQKLKEDKDNLDISNDMAIDASTRSHHTRKLRKRGLEVVDSKTTKRRNMSATVVIGGLKDHEVWDDLLLLRMKPVKAKPKGSKR